MKLYKLSQNQQDPFSQLIDKMKAKGYITFDYHNNPEKCIKYRDGSVFFTFSTPDEQAKLAMSREGLFLDHRHDVVTQSIRDDRAHCLIGGIVVSPQARGKGLASKITNDFMQCAKELNFQVDLEPSPMNDYNSKSNKGFDKKDLTKWYKSLGFKNKYPDSPLKDRILSTHPNKPKF